MNILINRIINFKHWEIFLIFVVIIFTPFSILSNNFFNLILKFLIILFLSYLYYFTIFVFIYKKLNKLQLKVKKEINITKRIFYFRSIFFISALMLFIIDNSFYNIFSNEVGFIVSLSIIISLFFISSIMWFFFINFISKYLYFLEKNKKGSFSEYLGYFISFLFIPIGIFIVQPIINEIFDKENIN